MEGYVFTLHAGEREVYREEILAITDEDAIDLACGSLRHMRAAPLWTLARLTDIAGRMVWEAPRDYPVLVTPQRHRHRVERE